MKEKSMGHLLPRKIKKACKFYLDGIPLKTKRMRYVYSQVKGFDYVAGTVYYYTRHKAFIHYMILKLR